MNETKTASAIYARLPLKSKVNLWGKEIYFSVDIHLPLEDGKDTVNIGDIAYWPDGPAICIFFGPTPISKKDEIKPYSEVSIIGNIDRDYIVKLNYVKSGEEILMKPITDGGD
ncbi:MAG: cyclophilin-like fold protein [bacterium]|nr:cyclophilin-like fold protein [bacterium]